MNQITASAMRSYWDFPFTSGRSPTLADALVCTSQPLAARAGMAALDKGGNAADAALAAAITLSVVEPVMNGLGSDSLALISTGNELFALNGSGRAPGAWSPERFQGRSVMPTEGWDSVTVPGAVAAWRDLSRRFCRLPLADLFESALHYSQAGFVVPPIAARQWSSQVPRLKDQHGFADAFLPHGRAPMAGERFRLEGQQAVLAQLRDSEGRALYEGALAERLVRDCAEQGGVLSLADLQDHDSQWCDPVTLTYRTLTVHQMPPNAQGLSVLMALGILQQFDLGALAFDSVQKVHLQIEAMKLAFDSAYRFVTDSTYMTTSVETLLAPARLAALAASINPYRASSATVVDTASGGTVYVAAVDQDGMFVSFMQSNYQGFGSGVVVPGTGISLHNRGAGFSLEADHPNRVAAHKRPFHTILPALLSRDGVTLGTLGVVGANMQPQGQMQILCNLEDHHFNPQAAVDAPRWRILEDGTVTVEHEFGSELVDALARLGHPVARRPRGDFGFGGAQLIMRLKGGGGYCGASDGRRDGMALGY